MAKLIVPKPVADTLASWVFKQTFHYALNSGEIAFEIATNDYRYSAIKALVDNYERSMKNG